MWHVLLVFMGNFMFDFIGGLFHAISKSYLVFWIYLSSTMLLHGILPVYATRTGSF
jgi:hypothetical protein